MDLSLSIFKCGAEHFNGKGRFVLLAGKQSVKRICGLLACDAFGFSPIIPVLFRQTPCTGREPRFVILWDSNERLRAVPCKSHLPLSYILRRDPQLRERYLLNPAVSRDDAARCNAIAY